MSIATTPLRAGSRAVCRRLLDISDPKMEVNLGTFPDANIKGNLAHGRSGQRVVLDGLDVFGTFDGNSFTVAVRDSANNDASGTDLHFCVTNFTVGEQSQRNIQIRKFGYVPDQSGTSDYEAKRWLGTYVTAATSEQTADVMAHIRYLGRDEAQWNGVAPGAWASDFHTALSTGDLLAAPGVGFYYRIRTLIVMGCGGTLSHSVLIGGNAVPANRPLRRFYASPAVNGFRLHHVEVDTDIVVPENQPVRYTAGVAFQNRLSIIVGAEKCKIEDKNFVNLTGVPQ